MVILNNQQQDKRYWCW